MAGNVWQWCWDWYGAYGGGSNPRGASPNLDRVLRGGGWEAYAENCRSAYRGTTTPRSLSNYTGFRAVLSAGQ